MAGRSRKRAPRWLPPTEPMAGGRGYRQMRDGEPRYIRLRRWQGDSLLSASHTTRCCDCGLRHLEAIELLRTSDGQYYLGLRNWRLTNKKVHVCQKGGRPRGHKK